MKKDQAEKVAVLLAGTRIFRDADPQVVARIPPDEGAQLVAFQKGEVLLGPARFRRQLGMLVVGTARVKKRKPEGDGVILSNLAPGDLFGAATLFNDAEYYPTQITAHTKCQALLLSRELVCALFRQDVSIAENYISYLTERIFFLNRKIDSFTLDTAEDRLLTHLLENSVPEGSGRRAAAMTYNMRELADVLGIGRASLYRAFDELAKSGRIIREDKRVVLIGDPQMPENGSIG